MDEIARLLPLSPHQFQILLSLTDGHLHGYGIFPAILSADIAAQMHGDTEHMPLAAVREAAEVLFDALRAALKP